jgi:lipopolysaccharide export system protein LptA
MVEITSRFMVFQMPSTNAPHRTLLASNEVVIVSESDQSRATGDQAAYSDATGVFELTGNAEWQSEQGLVRGDTLRFDRTNEVFNALNNAFLRLPLAGLGGSMAVAQWLDATNTAPESAQFIEVTCREIDYTTSRVQFRDGVVADLFGGPQLLGRMHSSLLTLSTNVEGRRIVAEGGVKLVQVPTLMPNGVTVDKQLDCELATVNIGTNGLIRSMIAETNVLFRQTERLADPIPPTQMELAAEIITANFAPHTNQVDSVIAERQVVITQNTGGAKGDRAVYDREKDSLLLTGDVTLESPRGILSAPAAILRHFGLWPGKLNQIQLPASGGPRPGLNPDRNAGGTPN